MRALEVRVSLENTGFQAFLAILNNNLGCVENLRFDGTRILSGYATGSRLRMARRRKESPNRHYLWGGPPPRRD